MDLERKQSSPRLNRNFSSRTYHESLNRAKSYTDIVQNHFVRSKYQNYVLASANRYYNNKARQSQQKKHYSTTKSNNKFPNPQEQKTFKRVRSQRIQNRSSEIKPLQKDLVPGLIKVFSEKTQKISEIQANFMNRLSEKKALSQRIKQLKELINQEKKIASKLKVNASKHMNDEQRTKFEISQKEQTSRRHCIHILQLQNQCLRLKQQIAQVNQKNCNTLQQVAQQTKVRNELKQYVFETRIKLREQQLLLAETKQMQTVAYKAMTNDYMIMNQLKQEKAKLLNYIQEDVREHPRCVPFNIAR